MRLCVKQKLIEAGAAAAIAVSQEQEYEAENKPNK